MAQYRRCRYIIFPLSILVVPADTDLLDVVHVVGEAPGLLHLEVPSVVAAVVVSAQAPLVPWHRGVLNFNDCSKQRIVTRIGAIIDMALKSSKKFCLPS